jgi:hypothetical protein
MFVGGGGGGGGGGQPRDYWRVTWRWNFLTAAPLSEISVSQVALQITSDIKQEVLSRTYKAFFYYCIDLHFHIFLSIIAVIPFYFFEEHAAEV